MTYRNGGHNIKTKRNESLIEKRKQGWSYGQIAKVFHISRQRANAICRFYNVQRKATRDAEGLTSNKEEGPSVSEPSADIVESSNKQRSNN